MTTRRHDDPPSVDELDTAASPEEAKVVTARDLFEGRREILIEHEGECYRLRITRRNRLILQK